MNENIRYIMSAAKFYNPPNLSLLSEKSVSSDVRK